jgi:hypothetical protein
LITGNHDLNSTTTTVSRTGLEMFVPSTARST